MRKPSKILAVFLIAVVMIACANSKGRNEDISVPGFDSKLWREDSISCNGYRAKVADSLIEYKRAIQGKSKEAIKTFLGSPNVEYSSYRYFIENGVQCLGYVTKNGYDSLETASIVLDFDDKNIVSDVRKITP